MLLMLISVVLYHQCYVFLGEIRGAEGGVFLHACIFYFVVEEEGSKDD